MPIEKASLKIKGRDVGFQTTKYGEFWRILLPGYYKLEVEDFHGNKAFSKITKAFLCNRFMPKDIHHVNWNSW